ncbi:MAG: sugar transferase [Patescibacteria group bacterium]
MGGLSELKLLPFEPGDGDAAACELEIAAAMDSASALRWPLRQIGWGQRNCLQLTLKRCFDLMAAALGLLVLLPFLLVLACIIRIDTSGPVLYRQKRVGVGGREFCLYKLRTMTTDAEKNGPCWAEPADPRVTRIGKFLRRHRLDELPQLWNVLRGDMSLVGPRPERMCFILQFMRENPNFLLRLTMRPGITGLAQVNGGYDLSPDEKAVLDMDYIYNFSLARDLRIILKTPRVVLRGDGAH